MSSEPAISVRNLSKCYKLGTIGRHTLVDEAQYLWHKIRGRDPREHFSKIGHTATEARRVEAEQEGSQEFWALKDVSFDVQPGEVIGVIGRNGAGKSTLLKILTRITEPTSGEAFINGRVASLLEVGTGFHPELTGRENVYMNGTILGMKRREIAAKFDEIVAFSELEKFIDTPVKRYSSGMYVRLAFAVAAHLDPEILLIDEVLAVGDAEFQRKCLGKMGDVASEGRTVLFVSHNMAAVQKLCQKALLLKGGMEQAFGDTADIIDVYMNKRGDTISVTQDVKVWITQAGETSNRPAVGQTFQIHIEFNTPSHLEFIPNIIVMDSGFRPVFSVLGWENAVEPGSSIRINTLSMRHVATVTIPPGLLNQGEYYLNFNHIDRQCRILERYEHCFDFSVVEDGYLAPFGMHVRWIGVMRPRLKWKVEPQ